ncbi:cell wall anchor protein [Mangrovimonas aestuarii]|uniref:cell wall anchor protein n=1 Tax=Mangrovimonas aestuarii TaxID=3018443 RepID=UPI002379D3E2|nr:cell wall anchor protein [Mangrovimonas aestuarii]
MKLSTIISLVMFCLCINYGWSQVGIGTTSPDPSSILDLTSTNQGMLTPRMTTTQRTNISNPAEGLLVFDTDENAFYYNDGDNWIQLAGATYRDKYKLVKSVADLSDELSAGGGAKYLLTTDYLYEINGEIAFDYPIDLNGAYIAGGDSGEDILTNETSGPLFQGATGGSIRLVTINGNGSEVFDISASSSENLIVNNVIVLGASSLGSLSTLGVSFFSITQFSANNDGLVVSDIDSFFMSNVFWTDSNTGTFLTASGTFNYFQLANGRVVANSGEAGIDVSANPTVSTSGSITEINFNGDGDMVVEYSSGSYDGYNFTNNWDIDSPGIALETDSNATGDINLNASVGTGINNAFNGTGSGSRKKLEGSTTSSGLFRFLRSGDNRIVYDGSKTRHFQVNASISFKGENVNNIFIFYIAKGELGGSASVVENTRVYREVGSNDDIGAVAIVGSIELAPGDYLELWAERYSGSGDLDVVSMNLVAN